MADDTTAMILPGDADDHARRVENRLRRRLLSGRWLDALTDRIAEHFDGIREQAIGRPTMSRNLARTVIRQLSCLYDQAPVIRNETDSPANEAMLAAVRSAGLWEMGTRIQQTTLLVREGLRAISTVGPEGSKQLLYRQVPLDMCWMQAEPQCPDEPVRLIEARRRHLAGKWVWTWDAWTIAGDEPRYAVLRPRSVPDGGDPFQVAEDITDHPDLYPGMRFEGAAYGWRYSDGKPFLPFTLYHAERTGELLDSWEGTEIVDGTLDVAALWTFWLHCVKDASWPQRYVLNAILRGEGISGGEGKEKFASVPADPSSIMQFYSQSMTPASFGQWVAGTDPNALEMSISAFERATAAQFNLAPSDFQAGGGAESGYALSIKRQAVREAQRRFQPQFARGDGEVLRKSAAMANRDRIVPGASEVGWELTYPALPMSPEERTAAKERIEAYKGLGLPASRIWQVQQLEQVDRPNALEILVQWQRDEQELAGRLAAEGGTATGLTEQEVVAMRAMLAAGRPAQAPPPQHESNPGAPAPMMKR